MAASFADTDIWHVMIADDMKRMNVEQLDDAFRLSLVDASTMVWKAGMKGWQSLGAVAGIDDEPEESVTRRAPLPPPPPPRPIARPVPKPPSPRTATPLAFQTTTPAYAAPLLAPVHPLALTAPDPYVLPKRRVAVPSEVDFRRRSGGVRWGRWLVALLLVTGGVLGAYRQNLLREGARRVGLENKYLYGERRVTSFVSAKAPPVLKQALTRLALLPGPNAARPAPPPPVVHAPPPPVSAPAAVVAETPKPAEPEVKTVSLDSLPTEAAVVEKPVAAAPVPHAKPAVVLKQKPAPKPQAKPQPKAEKPVKEAAKPAPAPVTNENPLKAAIRSAIAADAKKK